MFHDANRAGLGPSFGPYAVISRIVELENKARRRDRIAAVR